MTDEAKEKIIELYFRKQYSYSKLIKYFENKYSYAQIKGVLANFMKKYEEK